MFRKRVLCCLLALCCLLGLGSTAFAAEVDCDSVYCFTAADFGSGEEPLKGICITGLPAEDAGTVMLGSRVLRQGDILTAEQVAAMTFVPLRSQEDRDAVVTYLPIYDRRVDKSAAMTISIRGKEDKAPVAEDFSLETYKNLPLEGRLKAMDPEGEKLTYTVIRQSKRGTVEIREDGSFTYTPKKNKVGTDSFVFTAADPAGNVSREATVTIQILKPTQADQYTDTVGESCRFAAEWMKNTGIFVGETLGGQSCFQPDKAVTRGEFLTMLTQALGLPLEEEATFTGYSDAPQWLKPYLASALRSGMTAGLPYAQTGEFGAEEPITGAEAAVMLQNVMDLAVITQTQAVEPEHPGAKEMMADREELAQVQGEAENAVPAWAETALTVMGQNGITLEAEEVLTRGEASMILYQASLLAAGAPGLRIYQ